MGASPIICLFASMMDEVTGNGGSIEVNKMEMQLGVPVVPIFAADVFGEVSI